MTDWEQQVIFDRMLLPFAVIGLLHTVLAGLPAADHLLAALAGGGLFLLLAILTRGGIGGGDIKLIAALGLWAGTEGLTAIAVSGLILGGLAALVLLITGRKNAATIFPTAPASPSPRCSSPGCEHTPSCRCWNALLRGNSTAFAKA